MRLYLAGPMTGYPEFNHPAFATATEALRRAGYEVFSPAEHDIQSGLIVAGMTGQETVDYRALLAADLIWICDQAEGIALLDNWNASKGATAEVAVGRAIGIESRLVAEWLS